ncbi:glycosyltransferase [Vibrio breoganii]|uniref:glycosyltransferase n=1 Tax=Vibrio breoganii TaxID=553239 RepID=UPI000C85FC9F|nr:glycosyltransferase [Vibrio breoganii]PMK30203.1 hypothetical protein BCU03_10755 [Vibrio breoganii]
MSKCELLLIIPSLRHGGAEKFTVNIYNDLRKNKVACKLLVLSGEEGYVDLLIDRDNVIFLNKNSLTNSLVSLTKVIVKLKPLKILTMFPHLNAVILLLKRLKVIDAEIFLREVNLASKIIEKKKFPIVYKWIYKFLYPFSELVVCQSNDMQFELKKYSKVNSIVINNPVDITNIALLSKVNSEINFNPGKKNLIFVGRITYQKGIDILLDFSSKLDAEYHLHIFGKGDKSQWLEEQIKSRNLSTLVTYHGLTLNPYSKIKQAHRLILSSRYEGFPNVALESLGLGVPIVSLPFKGGSNEIFKPFNSSVSFDDSYQGLYMALQESEQAHFNRSEIIDDIQARYGIEKISALYTNKLGLIQQK